ncbi:DUF4351 domain-containing protein [Okeania sp. SIO2B3]|uniref:DUF4351 domain-containing protein n=1 Tax=Okeania sp. SIO2B3 TaxID=2607784 RepID=UPI0013C1A6BA|nr:DUF4351 domain-containing protein [Okeania sp. SIO2B3]NET41935.1 DUF4351 domain-containing protein [Okeania sp. SIO2B3]
MKESVIYQDILQQGEQPAFQVGFERGFERGFQRGFERGFQKGQANIIFLVITHSLGNIPEEMEAKIRSLSISQLNKLAVAQLNFTSMDDLISWLNESEN